MDDVGNGGNANFTMPVSPMGYGGNGWGGGFGYPVMMGYPMMGGFGGGMGFGGDWSWIILLLLVCGGGWGGMGGFGGFGGGLGIDFPWLLNGQNQINANTNAGFDHAATQTALGNLSTAVTSGFGDVQLGIAGVNQNICSTGNSITSAINGAQNAVSQQLYTNEIASLNRSFAEQTANTQGFNGVQSTLCDIRYGNATNTRDIIESQTRGTQAVLDKLCQLELDTVKTQLAQAQRDNVGLQNQLNMANLATSQTAQTAQILAGQTAEVDALYNRLNTCPVPCTPVYGRTPIFTCNSNGCSGNTFFN